MIKMGKDNRKWILKDCWVLRNDPQYIEQYRAIDIKNGLILSISRSLYYLLKCFSENCLSFEDLNNYLKSKKQNIDISSFFQIVEKYSFLELFTTQSIKKRFFVNYQIESKVPVTNTPENVEIHFTHRCNLKCKHCFQASSPHDSISIQIESSYWRKIFQELEFYNVYNIVISGGEPLFYPEFNSLFKEIVNYRLRFNILTNGVLINDDIVDYLSLPNVLLTISMDGHNSKTHDFLRGKGAFEKLITSIKKLRKRNANVTLSYTIHHRNYEFIEDFIEFTLSLGIKSIGFLTIDPIGRALENNNLLFSSREINSITEKVNNLIIKYKDQVEIEYTDPMALNAGNKKSDIISCSAGTNRIAIASNGFVYPCVMAFGEEQFKLGDLKQDNLQDTWVSNDNIRLFRGDIQISDIPECFNCELKDQCTLKNCRLKNYKVNKSLFDRPLGCMLERKMSYVQL
jgi:radical SAM additional 4Fe4S-binding domain